jgi:hypothetical protein
MPKSLEFQEHPGELGSSDIMGKSQLIKVGQEAPDTHTYVKLPLSSLNREGDFGLIESTCQKMAASMLAPCHTQSIGLRAPWSSQPL